MTESRFADEDTLAHIAQLEALVKQQAAVIEAQSEQKPVAWCFVQNGYTHYTDDKRDWYDAVGIEEVTSLYAASVVQPGMVLVPREATEAMLAVIRNERGAYGTGESLYADLIAAAEGN